MIREELIEELSGLRDYHTVTQRTCDFLKMDLLRKDDHYNAGKDSRIVDLFEYISPTEKDFSKYIDFFAFAVIANLSRFAGSRATGPSATPAKTAACHIFI
ncbi:MAG: hypothetical protein LUG99_03875 [Lachnospiraceae bacterium]|nr:hypothetical protein [Lachnospiraceae bacterium]